MPTLNITAGYLYDKQPLVYLKNDETFEYINTLQDFIT